MPDDRPALFDLLKHRLPIVTRHGTLRIEHVERVFWNIKARNVPHAAVFEREAGVDASDYRVKRALELLKKVGRIRHRRGLRGRGTWEVVDG